MRMFMLSVVAVLPVGVAVAESPEPPIEDTRLRISTLVREDIFAGWLDNDMERFARAERNLDKLMELRPNAKAEALAWKGGAKLYRAVLAHEAGNDEEFEKYFQETKDLFAEAKKLGPTQLVVAVLVGGSYLEFADRLPEEHTAAAWAESYENYQIVWKRQGKAVDRLPRHIRGELLAGMAESAERTGREEECQEFLTKIIELLPGSQYQRVAEEWKNDPAARHNNRISCKYCHGSGRLEATVARLKD